ncbi:MAG: class I adenylate-forming enzyme family protein [Qingshengfaniella sp.]
MTYTDIVTPVFRHARARPDQPAFTFGDQVLTYAGLEDQARRIAAALLASDIGKGDRVAVFTPNRPELFSVHLGLALIGATIVPVNSEFAADEVRYILEHSDAALILRAGSLAAQVTGACDGWDDAPRIEDLDGFLEQAAGLAPYRGPQAGFGDDLVLLCYTSGTTSTPKGVAASHANELASAIAYSEMMAITPEDSELITLPLSFSYGFHAAAYVALLSGATIILTEKFHPRQALEIIDRQHPTIFLGVPTMYAMMADVAQKDGIPYDLSSLRMAASSGAVLNEQTLLDCRKHLGIDVWPYYAMTEVRPIFSFDLRHPTMPPVGSVGRLIAPTEVRLVGDDGQDVDDGATALAVSSNGTGPARNWSRGDHRNRRAGASRAGGC